MKLLQRFSKTAENQKGAVMYEWSLIALIIAVGLILVIINLAAGTEKSFSDPDLSKALTQE
ncbi:MAG: hypothetical protein KDD66_04265 [Bdellovibrionales bacterium]|nr:hypothetical protein [Bdellovibrionales bacterium]